jgi:hypothetical protein
LLEQSPRHRDLGHLERDIAAVRHDPGADYIEMKNLGHFPMSENYPLFKPYLKRALEIIEQKLSG